MRNPLFLSTLIVLIISFGPLGYSQIDTPSDETIELLFEASDDNQLTTLEGPGLSLLDFSDNPDEYGLTWSVNEPTRKCDNWTVAVKNESGEPVTNLVVTLEIEVDGEWYLGDIEGSNALVRPTIIPDGGVGMVRLGNVGGSPQNWTNYRIVVESINAPLSFSIIPLEFELTEDEGVYHIEVRADESQTVSNVWVIAGCVVDGAVSETKITSSDLLRFRPGDVEAFEFTYSDCEEQDGLPIFTVSGDVAD